MAKVKYDPCTEIQITVLCGRKISKGFFMDFIDTPDPYVILKLDGVPWPTRTTQTKDNNANPVWNETFSYILPERPPCMELKITLMEANFPSSLDQELGTVSFDLNLVSLEKPIKKEFKFHRTSVVDVEFRRIYRHTPDVRFSSDLAEEEIQYLSHRQHHTVQGLKSFLKLKNLTQDQAPRIAVIGSGGGYRATIGFAGAMKAIEESGLMDCVTYIGSLSGSSWYAASLYAHGGPTRANIESVTKRVRDGFTSQLLSSLLDPLTLARFLSHIQQKHSMRQPISLVDLYGLLVGNKILGESFYSAKLSDMAHVIKDGSAPFPVMTGIHVKAKTSEKDFADWLEFSPYEVGMTKYETFIKTNMFGSKFFRGCLIKRYEESPLHFFMGLWGSAFAIAFEAWMERNSSSPIKKKRMKYTDENLNSKYRKTANEEPSNGNSGKQLNREAFIKRKFAMKWKGIVNKSEEESRKDLRFCLDSIMSSCIDKSVGDKRTRSESESSDSTPQTATLPPTGILKTALSFISATTPILSQGFRASKIHNFFRGLDIDEKPTNMCDLTHPRNIIEDAAKKIFVVDAGLSFNIPVPPFLRKERKVDVIIAFDFSLRSADNSDPMRELLMAQRWTQKHNLPFPKIDRNVFKNQGMKECYVFEDKQNPDAPIVILLPLSNMDFRYNKSPGVPRVTKEEKEFGDFSLFEDPEQPYRTFSQCYTELAFDHLHDLVEFNTLNSMEIIKKAISSRVKRPSYTRPKLSSSVPTQRRDLRSNLVNTEHFLRTRATI